MDERRIVTNRATPDESRPPEGLDATYVLRQARTALTSEQARDLWRRVESEMSGMEVDAAYTYLRARFTSLASQVREDLAHLRETL